MSLTPDMSKLHRSLAALILLSLFSGFAFSFDTGPHFDLTRAVLSERGFGDDAIKSVQVENWLTDYFSTSPTISKNKREELEKLHCDNLFTTRQVDSYFVWLINNLKVSTQNAARNDDNLAMITTLGIGLHAIQDFYTHSNWVETHPRQPNGPYLTDTFHGPTFTKQLSLRGAIFTGKYPSERKSGPWADPIPDNAQNHGGYDAGLNHDSPVRERWDEAYVFAYVASHELVEAFAKWADETRPGFWKKVQMFAVDQAEKKKLEYDIAALRSLSMWIKGGGEDGHWKGNKSGSDRFLSAYSPKWLAASSSIFVKQMKDGSIPKQISENLYTKAEPPAMPDLPRFSLSRRAVIVRTTFIGESKDIGLFKGKISAMNGSDFYARITIGKQEYWDRVVQASNESTDPWYEIHFADTTETSVPIKIAVFDEDNIDPSKDPEMDINARAGFKSLSLVFNPNNGPVSDDLTGIFSTRETAFTSVGAKPDNNRTVIKGYVAQIPLR